MSGLYRCGGNAKGAGIFTKTRKKESVWITHWKPNMPLSNKKS